MVEIGVRYLQRTYPDLYTQLADSDTGKSSLDDEEYAALWCQCRTVVWQLEIDWSRFDLSIFTTSVRLKVAEEHGVVFQVSKTSRRNKP